MSEIEKQLRAFGQALDAATRPVDLDAVPLVESVVTLPRRSRASLAGLAAAFVLIGGVVGWFATSRGSDDSNLRFAAGTTTVPTQASTTPTTSGSSGTVEIRLDDIPMFVEGFDYGVRILNDGEVIAERDLRDFPGIYDRNRHVLIPVPPGTRLVVVSALSGSSGGATFPLDFDNGCTTNVTVPAGETVSLTLHWGSGCLDNAEVSPADEYGLRVSGQFGCGPAGGPGIYGMLRMNRDASVYVEVVSDDGTETLLGRSAIYEVVARIDTEFLLGIGSSDAERAELRLIDADRPEDGPIVVGSVQLRESNPTECR